MGWQQSSGWRTHGWRGAAAAALPLDGVSSVFAAYSFRKLATAFAGSAIRVRRSSDSTEQDIGFDGSGNFDAAAFSTFVGAGSGFIKTWYDQGGSGNDITQATAGSQAQVTLSGLNSQPVAAFGGSAQYDVSSLAGAPTTALAALSVGEITNNFTGMWAVSVGGAVNSGYDLRRASNFDAHGPDPADLQALIADDASFHQFSNLHISDLARIRKDGTTGTDGTGTSAFVTPNHLTVGAISSVSTFPLVGSVAELIFVGQDWTAGGDATLAANQKAYWGTP